MDVYLCQSWEAHSMLTVNFSSRENMIPNYDNMKDDEKYKYKTVNLGLFIIFTIITVVGILCNASVIYILLRYGQRLTTNCFLINLAITDFTFLAITSPVTASFYLRSSWIFGDAFCKIVMYMIHVTLHATCLTLTVMTVDRYTSIVHVFTSRRWRTTKFAVKVCTAVWGVSFLISIPFAIYYKEVNNVVTGKLHCLLIWPEPQDLYNKVSAVAIAGTTYVLPLTVIIFCYSRILCVINHRNDSYPLDNPEKENQITSSPTRNGPPRWRTTKLVILLVVVFALLWFPVHFLVTWDALDEHFPKTFTTYLVKGIAKALSYSNSCINPFLYVFMSKGFRQALKRAFPNAGSEDVHQIL